MPEQPKQPWRGVSRSLVGPERRGLFVGGSGNLRRIGYGIPFRKPRLVAMVLFKPPSALLIRPSTILVPGGMRVSPAQGMPPSS
jgi:hypothetical protein